MTNEEMKKKIAQIIADYFCPQGNEHKKLWGDDRLCYSKMNFAECEWVTECTDALIAAGYGDVKDLQAQVNALEMTNIALQAGYDDAEKDRLYWVDKYKEAEHRADVAERALRNAAPRLNCRGGLGKGFCKVDKCDYYHCNNDDGCVKAHLDQAEKELAEEGKDD